MESEENDPSVIINQLSDLDLKKNKVISRLFSTKNKETIKSVDIRLIPNFDLFLEKKNWGEFFDITINSLMYNPRDGIVDPSGKGLTHLKQGIIECFDIDDVNRHMVHLIRALKFSIKLNFKFAEKTEKDIILYFPQYLWQSQKSEKINETLLKLFLTDDTKKTLAHLLQYLSKQSKVRIVDLLFSPEISEGIKKAYINFHDYEEMIKVIEKAKKEKNNDFSSIQQLFINFYKKMDDNVYFKNTALSTSSKSGSSSSSISSSSLSSTPLSSNESNSISSTVSNNISTLFFNESKTYSSQSKIQNLTGEKSAQEEKLNFSKS